MISQELHIKYHSIIGLSPYQNNARTHSKRQIKQTANSIERFGFTNPVLIADDGGIIAGHGRVRAAELLGMAEVPTLKLSHLDEAERKAYINGGMGIFYRSKHELIFVYKKGTKSHTNSFGLGDTGRYRTNVWDYAGISSMSSTRGEELEMHPTVKPVAMIEDAIKDCSRRREIILDIFGGSGSTLIAAERTGRAARLLEYEPSYCDTIIRCWQQLTGQKAELEKDGREFNDIEVDTHRAGHHVVGAHLTPADQELVVSVEASAGGSR